MVHDKFHNKWWLSSEKKTWSLSMNKTQQKNYCFAVRLAEDITLEYDDVCLTNDLYPVHNVVQMVDRTDIVGVKENLALSILDDVIN